MTTTLLEDIHFSHKSSFSPNLYLFLRKNLQSHLVAARDINGKREQVIFASVYRAKDPNDRASLYIGAIDDGYLNGAKMNEVLTHGSAAKTWAFPLSAFEDGVREIPNFWEEYLEKGRCVIDTNHTTHFLNDGDRFKHSHDGQERTCQWCGQVQLRKIREKVSVVKVESWHTQEALNEASISNVCSGQHEARVEIIKLSHTITLPGVPEDADGVQNRIQVFLQEDPLLANAVTQLSDMEGSKITFQYQVVPGDGDEVGVVMEKLATVVEKAFLPAQGMRSRP